MYASAAFAKLNSDFLDYRTSSNTVFLVKLLCSPPFLGPRFGVNSGILADAAWAALLRAALLLLELAELGIPILFWLGQPSLGAAMNWLFHLFVGMAAYNFSCSGTGSLPLVLQRASLAAGLRFMTTSPAARAAAIAAVLALALSQSPQPGAPDSRNRLHGLCVSLRTGSAEKNAIHLTWLAWALLLAAGLARQASGAPAEEEAAWWWAPANRAATAAGALIAAVFLVTCLAPYLGLPKTHSTFTMFSNLRVEGGRTNHLLYRYVAWMAPFGFLRDVVSVTATDCVRIRFFMRASGGPDTCPSMAPLIARLSLGCTVYGQLKRGAGSGGADESNTVFPYQIPHLQLRALVSDEFVRGGRRSFFVQFSRGGRAHRIEVRDGELVEGDAGLLVPLPVPLRPWVFCRAVQMDEVGLCYH